MVFDKTLRQDNERNKFVAAHDINNDDATAISGGTVLYEDIVASEGTGSKATGTSEVVLIEQDFISTRPITICVRQISGSGGTATCLLRAVEEW